MTLIDEILPAAGSGIFRGRYDLRTSSLQCARLWARLEGSGNATTKAAASSNTQKTTNSRSEPLRNEITDSKLTLHPATHSQQACDLTPKRSPHRPGRCAPYTPAKCSQ